MTWQPIETAPKDGTRILVYAPKSNFGKIAAVCFEDEKWILARSPDGEYVGFIRNALLTHWMPRPAPPSTQQEERG